MYGSGDGWRFHRQLLEDRVKAARRPPDELLEIVAQGVEVPLASGAPEARHELCGRDRQATLIDTNRGELFVIDLDDLDAAAADSGEDLRTPLGANELGTGHVI